MADFDDSYTCFNCGRKGAPDHGKLTQSNIEDGFYVECPDCAFEVAGPMKLNVMTALIVLAAHRSRVEAIMMGVQ